MHLDERCHAPMLGRVLELAGERVVHGGENDEDAVRAPGPRLDHLIGVDHEILAQDGKARRLARRGQIVWRALEGRRVGENGEALGAARLIGAGEGRRVEIGANEAPRGARLLDLGNEREAARHDPVGEPVAKAAGGLARLRLGLEPRQRPLRLGPGDLVALVGENVLQHVSHGRALPRFSLSHWRRRRGHRARLAPAPRRWPPRPLARPRQSPRPCPRRRGPPPR